VTSSSARSPRERAFIAAATPFALAVALAYVVTALHPHITWKWKLLWKPLQLVGIWFGGCAAPFVSWNVLNGDLFPVVGWAVVLSWCWAVRRTRLGDIGWMAHAAISLVWVFVAFWGWAYAVRGF
jgi:hypothetical protein